MRKLTFVHRKSLQFDHPVFAHSFSLRLIPLTNSRQIISNVSYSIQPSEHSRMVQDGRGHSLCIGDCDAEHMDFYYEVSGTAWVSDTPYVDGPIHAMYRFPSALTGIGSGLRTFYEQHRLALEAPALTRASAWMQAVYAHFCYTPGATSVSTTAEDAAALGKGVCQDYAHMMIALCRMDHIPARYVAGYLVGEGETHAWLEIYDGARWVGMDPTHNRMVGDQYISIIFGRDYNDCILDKGFFRSTQNKPVLQTQQVHVSVFDAVNHNSNSKDDNL